MTNVHYELMRPKEIIARRDEVPLVYVPISPLEWHGPHMPYGTDVLHAHTLAVQACEITGGVVLPPIPLGTETFLSEERLKHRGFRGDERVIGMDFPALSLPSLYIEESAFGVVVRDLVLALKRQKYKVIAIINGHGGQNHLVTLDRIAWETSEPPGIQVLHIFGPRMKTGKEHLGGHAEVNETSVMMKYYPESVDLNELPQLPGPLKSRDYGILDGPTCRAEPADGYVVRDNQDPRHATPENGARITKERVEAISARVHRAVQEATGGKSQA